MKAKIFKIILLVLALLIISALALPAFAQNVPCYFEQGGAKFIAVVFRSTACEWEMQTGTTLDIQSGVTETHANDPTFTGSPTFSGVLTFTGAANFGAVDIDGALTSATGALTVTDDVDINGSLTSATGALTITDDVDIDGALTSATGALTITDNVDIDGALTSATGALTITDNVDIDGTLTSATGALTITDDVDIDGALTSATGALTITDDVDIDGALTSATGALTITDDVDIDGALTSATGALTITDNVDIAGNITSVTGAVTVTDALLVTGAADFTYVQGIDAGAVGDALEIAFTTPVDTAGSNTHNAVTVDLAIGASTGGVNAVTAVQVDTVTSDAQVVEKALNIGPGWDIAVDTTSPIVSTAIIWMDDFLGDTVLAQYTEVSGSDTEAVQTIVEEQYGVYQLTSGDDGGSTAADLEAVYLSLEWSADQGALIYEARLHLDTDIATVEICAGFTDDVSTVELPFTNASDTVTAVADDAIMLCFDTGSTTVEWFANGAAGGTEATGIAATGVAPAGDVYQTLRIEIDSGGEDCRFYIDTVLVGTLTANCVTNTDLLAPGVVISSGGNAGSNIVDIDYIFAAATRD